MREQISKKYNPSKVALFKLLARRTGEPTPIDIYLHIYVETKLMSQSQGTKFVKDSEWFSMWKICLKQQKNEFPEKETKKDFSIQKICLERSYS